MTEGSADILPAQGVSFDVLEDRPGMWMISWHLLEAVDDGGRMHGHSYLVDVHVAGPVGEAFAPVLDALDHRLLNEIDGLANPTAEHLAA